MHCFLTLLSYRSECNLFRFLREIVNRLELLTLLGLPQKKKKTNPKTQHKSNTRFIIISTSHSLMCYETCSCFIVMPFLHTLLTLQTPAESLLLTTIWRKILSENRSKKMVISITHPKKIKIFGPCAIMQEELLSYASVALWQYATRCL